MRRYFFILLLVVGVCTTTIPSSASAVCYGGRELDANGVDTGPCTTPAPSASPSNGGIFGCTAPGATSIGSTAAIGGTYVPVFDAAVALNTGVIAYKECVLRPTVNKQKQYATAAMSSDNYRMLSQGRDDPYTSGQQQNPFWVKNYGTELGGVSKKAADDSLLAIYNASQSGNGLNKAFVRDVVTTLNRSYAMTTNAPQSALACSYQGDLSAVLAGQTKDVWGGLSALIDPACSPYSAYVLAQSERDSRIAAAQTEWQTRLNWNNGIYDSVDRDGNVVVPGIFLNAIGTQSLTSGFRQMENADDIGEMVGALFANIGNTLLRSPASVASVQTAYDQAVKEAGNNARSQYTSTALNNLQTMLRDEQQYNEILAQEATTLKNAVDQLHAEEKACWEKIVPKVCPDGVTSSASGNTCKSASGATLTVATSTEFSDAAIAKAKIQPMADKLAVAADVSTQNLTTLNSLIAGVQSSDSAIYNAAFKNLEIILNFTPSPLHTQSTVSQEQENLRAIQEYFLGPSSGGTGFTGQTINAWKGNGVDQFGSAVPNAVAWDGTTDPGIGWCNVTKPSTIDQWVTKWTP